MKWEHFVFVNVKLESTEILEDSLFIYIFWFIPFKDDVRITEYSKIPKIG